jgi:hypothetical protein
MARSLIARGDVSLDRPAPVALPGRGGRIYAVYGIGQTLIFAAPEILIRIACGVTGSDCDRPFWEDVSIAISSLVLFPLISAVGIVFLCLALGELGFDQNTAVASAMLVACGSLILPYAKFHQEENQIFAITFATVYFAVRFFRGGRNRDAVVAAALCWLPMWFRVSALAETIPLAIFIMVLAFKRASWKRAVMTLIIAGAITGLWLMFYNWHRFGSVVDTGYLTIYKQRGDLEANIFEGLAGPFFHPSKSLLLYSPLVVLAAWGAFIAFRDWLGRALVLTSIAILSISVMIPSSLRSWSGDTSWGPRYQVAGHAMLLLFVAYVLSRRSALSLSLRVAVTSILLWAILIQVVGIGFNYNLEYHRGLPDAWDQHAVSEWYSVSHSQIPLRLDSIWKYKSAWAKSPAEPHDAIEEYSIPAFLPWKLGQRFGSRVWLIAVLIWLAGCAAWGVLCRRFLARILKDAPDVAELNQ